MTALTIQPNTDLSALTESALRYAACAKSDSTRRSYQSAWEHFERFCLLTNRASLPADPETVALYVAQCADNRASTSTIDVRLSAISQAHKIAGLASPRLSQPVQAVRTGVRRTLGVQPSQKAAVSVEELRAMIAELDSSTLPLRAARDRAILLIGFAAALRRSEIVALRFEDIEWCKEGVVLTIRSSKTDQEGAGMQKAIPYGDTLCPVRALSDWVAALLASGIFSGPVFMSINRHGGLGANALSDQVVADIVQALAARCGLDAERFGAHSLKAGLVTAALASGATEGDVMRQSGHVSAAVMRKYNRQATLFVDNVAGRVGL